MASAFADAQKATLLLYKSLIDAKELPGEQDLALPEFKGNAIQLQVLQYLIALIDVLFRKIWSPTARIMCWETLYYLYSDQYNWMRDPAYAIPQRLEMLSRYLLFLERASAYQMSTTSKRCQDALYEVMVALRTAINQWFWNVYTGDLNSRIDGSNQFIDSIWQDRSICTR